MIIQDKRQTMRKLIQIVDNLKNSNKICQSPSRTNRIFSAINEYFKFSSYNRDRYDSE